MYLTGYGANSRGDGVTNDLGPMKLPPSQKAPQPTSAATMIVNLDARSEIKKAAGATVPKNFDPNDDSTFAHATSCTVYDDSGNKSTVKVYYRRVDDAEATFQDETNTAITRDVQQYKMYMSVTDVAGNVSWVKKAADAVLATGGNAGSAPVFDTVSEAPAGDDTKTDDFNLAYRLSGDKTSTVNALQFFGGQNIDAIYRDKKTGESVSKTEVSFSIVTGTARQNSQPIKLSLTDTTRYSADFEVKDLRQDGYPIGALNAVSFDESGQLYGIYSNGQRLVAGQAVLAQFKSTDGLSGIAQNLFAQTVASGEALLGVAGSGSYGVVRNTALEEANIDMASQLVNLMVQQRNYQANSESIRAQDELLKSTISLAR